MFERLFNGRGAFFADQLFDEFADVAFGQRAQKRIDRAARFEGEHGRDRLHAQLLGEIGMLVDIDFDELDLALGLAHDLFDRRAQLFARAAPRRPKIDDDGRFGGGRQHILLERLVARILDKVAGGGGRIGLGGPD